jgi:hypothetical protein
MPKPPKFGMIYSDAEVAIIIAAAEKDNYKDLNRFIMYRLLRECSKMRMPILSYPSRKKRYYIRINNKDVMAKLDAYSKLNGIAVPVLIKRLTTDPILLAAQMEEPPALEQTHLPESL